MELEKESLCTNLKISNSELCRLWQCKNLNKDYPCITCPVMRDLSIMADAFHMRVDFCNETLEV